MPDIGFVNGRFMPLSEAVIPVEDRGYQFGDGIYEVIRTYRGVPFQLDAHISRLEQSARALDLSLPFRTEDWRVRINEGIRRAGYPECKVYIQLTRGVAPRDHVPPPGITLSVVMTVREMISVDERLRAGGVSAVTMEDLRWGRCDIKSTNLLPNVMARQQAQGSGAFESILIRDGYVTEGAVSNVLIVRSGVLCTPPVGPRILAGVTRSVVLDLARKEGLAVEERPVTLSETRAADEVLLTGTTLEILPVVRIDGQSVGEGRPGELTGLLFERFRRLAGLSAG